MGNIGISRMVLYIFLVVSFCFIKFCKWDDLGYDFTRVFF